jgi:succinate-semialdehyde dehydrogenase / glutarate-semialdehyde dehydrogenase
MLSTKSYSEPELSAVSSAAVSSTSVSQLQVIQNALSKSGVPAPTAVQLLVAGQWVNSHDSVAVISPIGGNTLGYMPVATTDQVTIAINAAQATAKTWQQLSGERRGEILLRAQVLLETRLHEIAQLYRAETGKPLAAAERELTLAIRYLSWFAHQAKQVSTNILESPQPNQCLWVLPRALGVVVTLTPAQFGAMMLIRHIAPALAAGCSVLVQPAANTSLTILALARAFVDAGLPSGCLSVLPTRDSWEHLEIYAQHPAVQKLVVSVASKALEHQILALASTADTLKRVSLERFGPAPMIIFADADLELAVNAALANKLLYSGGQTSLQSNRILVQASIAEAFTTALQAKVEALTVAGMASVDLDSPVHPDPGEIAPLANAQSLIQLDNWVNNARQQGATVVTGGYCFASPLNEGYYYAPTILTNVQDRMVINHQDIVGPVVLISAFQDEADLQNHLQTRLAATYLFTENLGRVFAYGDRLNAALVGVNDASFLSHEIPAESALSQDYMGNQSGLETYLANQSMLMRSGASSSKR